MPRSPSRRFQFTPRALAALKPGAERYEVRGGEGMRLRVYPTGAKSFRWYGPPCHDKRCKGGRAHRHWFVLGNFDSRRLTGLADAQKRLEELRTEDGHRRAVEAQLGKGEEQEASPEMTVGALADQFYRDVLVNRRKRPEIALDVLTRDIKPTIGDLPLSRFGWEAASMPVQAAVARGAPAHAVRVLQVLKQLTRWATGKHLATDPAAGLQAENLGASIGESDRFLTVEELAVVLPALNRASIEPGTRLAAKLLLATGLRTHELLTLKWTSVDLGDEQPTLSVDVENMKLGLKAARKRKGAPYVQPLSPYAVRLFRELERITKGHTFAFASWSESGRLGDKAVSLALRRAREADPKLRKLPAFSPHDFRRTLATWASDTFDETLAQRLLGHSLNSITRSGVASTYDRGQALERKRRALDAWGALLDGLDVAPRKASGKVVAIHRAG